MTREVRDDLTPQGYRAAYPVLSVRDCHNEIYLFDMINDNLKELVERQPGGRTHE